MKTSGQESYAREMRGRAWRRRKKWTAKKRLVKLLRNRALSYSAGIWLNEEKGYLYRPSRSGRKQYVKRLSSRKRRHDRTDFEAEKTASSKRGAVKNDMIW